MPKVKLSTIINAGKVVGILITKGNGCWNLRDIANLTKHAKVTCTHLQDVHFIVLHRIQQKLMEF